MWGAESRRAGSPPPRYTPVRRRTPVGGFDGRGSSGSSPTHGVAAGVYDGGMRGCTASSGAGGGRAAVAVAATASNSSPHEDITRMIDYDSTTTVALL